MCNGTANKFHKVVLHGETLVLVTTAIVANVEKVESGSTFGETCLATEVLKLFEANSNVFFNSKCLSALETTRGVLPYMGYIGMCGPKG